MEKLSYEYVKSVIEEKSCQLVSTEYVDSKKNLEIIFTCGHKDFRTFPVFKKSKPICGKCSGNQKYDFDEVFKFFLESGYSLLTNEYLGCKQDLDFEDAEGYRYRHNYGCFKDKIIKNTKPEKFGTENPFSTYNIRLFLTKNLPTLFLEENQEYRNSKSKLIFFDSDGYKYYAPFGEVKRSIRIGNMIRKFDTSNPFTMENIQHWLKLNDKSFHLIDGQKFLANDKNLKFKCHICNDDEIPFCAVWANIQAGQGCGICSGHQIGKYNNLAYNFPEVAKEWNYDKNKITPDKVSCHSGRKYHFICQKGHEYYTSIFCRTTLGHGCETCSTSHGEERIKKYLDLYKIVYVHQKRFPDCKYKNTLRFDFYLPEQNLAIEYQGELHVMPVEFFGGIEKYEDQKARDEVKRKYCQNKGINFLEIFYWDFENVENILEESLNLQGKEV